MFPGYRAEPHHELLARKLEAVERGEIRRLMVFMPPRHGKSELVSRRFPAWFLGRNPDRRIITCSYAAHLAERFSGAARDQFGDHRWPFGIGLDRKSQSKKTWDIAGMRGGYISAGVGGPITGEGAHLLIIDDPIKNAEEAESEVVRDAVWEWYTSTAYTRLEEADSAIVLVMTRWHEDDLAGRLLEEAEQGGDAWEVVSLPALAETGDVLGRAPGAALWPAKFDEARLENIRVAVGSRVWAALYQQRPTLEEGGLFKRQWFDVVDAAPDGLKWVRYWDLAVSTKTSADYTASTAVAFDRDGNLWVRDGIRGRWEWPDAKRSIKATMLAERADTIPVIEEALHGAAAMQEFLRDPELRGIPIYGWHVDKDKVTRAMAWAARAEARKVKLVRGEWVNAWLDEVCSFPHGMHDDYTDSTSGAVAVWSYQRTGSQGGQREIRHAQPANGKAPFAVRG